MVALIGLISGKMMVQKMRHVDAPSIRAASSSETGIERMKPVAMNRFVPVPSTVYRMIRPTSLSSAGAHLLRNRQHDDRERHEHGGDEEVVQEAEEALVHVAGHGVGHEGVGQQGEHHGGHRDDRGVERGLRVVDLGGGVGEVVPLPRGGQGEGAGFGRSLQRGDDGEVERDQNGQAQHGHGGGQPPVDLVVPAELGGLAGLGRGNCCSSHFLSSLNQICSAAGDAQLYEGDDRQHDEEEHGVCGLVGVLATGQATLPDEVGDGFGGGVRTALGQGDDLIEGAERVLHGQHEVDGEERSDQRECDLPELAVR